MISTFLITVTIRITFSKLVSCLEKVVPKPDLIREKHRIIGEEVDYNTDEVNMYAYSLDQKKIFNDGTDTYQVEFSINNGDIVGNIFLGKINEVFEEEGLPFNIDYSLVDGDGEQIGEEQYIYYRPDN